MSTNVKSMNDVNTNKLDIFMLVMVVLPLFLSIVSLFLFLAGIANNYYPNWLIIVLLINLFIMPIIDLILLSSNGVEFTEPVKSSIFCFPLYVYFREKMTDNSKIIFAISIVSYLVSIFLYFMHILSNGADVGSTIIYILGIFGSYALLLKLFSAKDDKSDMVYMVYMMNTVILLVAVLAIHVVRLVLKL